jgi:hypothetical protein
MCGGDLTHQGVMKALDFLIKRGLADRSDAVREALVQSGMALVDHHGSALAPQLLTLFETFLDKKPSSSPPPPPSGKMGTKGGLGLSAPNQSALQAAEEERYDLVRCGVVVFLGTLAKHLQAGDSKRQAVVETLLQVLSTPSEVRPLALCS